MQRYGFHGETPATSNNGCRDPMLTSLPSAQVHRIHSRTRAVLSLFSTLNFEHNISVSGNPSQQVISSRQPVIYSKCLNEPKSFLWSEVACPGRQMSSLLLTFNKICLCTKAYKSFHLCCLPGNNKIMNLNMKQSLSLPSIIVFLFS